MPVKSQSKPDFETVFDRLKAILQPYEKGALKSRTAENGNFALVAPATPASRNRELWFGEVRKGKAYVSYHLIAVYANPALLEGMSPELKKRMQGKSCFNFKSVDETLFTELSELTERGIQRFRQAGFLGE